MSNQSLPELPYREPYTLTLECGHEYTVYYPSKVPRGFLGIAAFCSQCGLSKEVIKVACGSEEYKQEEQNEDK